MDRLAEHDAVFQRLLFDRGLRAELRAGRWDLLGDAAAAFATIDLDLLEQLVVAIRSGLVKGTLGGLGIGAAFPDTIAALGGGADEVVERFLLDTGGADVEGQPVDGTGRRAGRSLLEAFYSWAVTRLADRSTPLCRAQHELSAALLMALTRTPRPGFLVQWPLVHAGPRGFYCMLDAARPLAGPEDPPEQPVAYVAVGGRYATGRLSVTLAAVVLEGAERPPAWAKSALEQLDAGSLGAVRRALAQRGLA